MKRLINIVLTLILSLTVLFSFSTIAFAEGEEVSNEVVLNEAATDPTANYVCTVDDKAGVLSDSEEAVLLSTAKIQSKLYGLSICFLTYDDAEGKSEVEYTDDYYDQNIASQDGILLAIDFDNRQVYINTVGSAITNITDSEIDDILDNTYAYCSNQEYMNFFVFTLSEVLYAYADGQNSYGENIEYAPIDFGNDYGFVDSAPNPWIPDVPSLIATVVVMAIVVITLLVLHNKNNREPSANEYINNSFEVNSATPIFLGIHEEVIHDFYKESSSSGGSSHMSSGGVSHGGGGHSF